MPVSTVLLYILGVVVVALGVLLSILLHEAGHFVFAKLFKVRVGQFMVGFGKTLWSRKIGETEFGIKALPLGGYISMSGMYPPVKPGGRARTASTGFFQTLVQDAGPGIVDTLDPEPEDQDDRSGFFKTLVSDARSASADTILPGHEDRVFYKLAIWKRILIMLGGPVMNLIIAIVLFAIIICGLGAETLSPTVSAVPACVLPATSTSKTCTSGAAASPAADAGFKTGDTIEKIGATKITSWTQVTSIIQKSAGKSLTIVVLRGGKDVTLTAVPVHNKAYVLDSKGNQVLDSHGVAEVQEVGFLGIDATITLKPLSPSYILPAVWDTTTKVGGVVINLPQRMVGVWNAAFGTAARDPNGPIGVVGVGPHRRSDRHGRQSHSPAARAAAVGARIPQHRALRVQPDPAHAARWWAHHRRALGGPEAGNRETLSSTRPRAGRYREGRAPHVRRRDRSRCDEPSARLRRHRQANQPAELGTVGPTRQRIINDDRPHRTARPHHGRGERHR